ncbi:unnamed protein product [Boreogadus saida]
MSMEPRSDELSSTHRQQHSSRSQAAVQGEIGPDLAATAQSRRAELWPDTGAPGFQTGGQVTGLSQRWEAASRPSTDQSYSLTNDL